MSVWQDKPEMVEFEIIDPDEYYDKERYLLRIMVGGEWKNIQFTKDTNRYQLASVFSDMAEMLRRNR